MTKYQLLLVGLLLLLAGFMAAASHGASGCGDATLRAFGGITVLL